MGRIFFVRRTANDLLKEQNILLAKLLEAQRTQPAQIVYAGGSAPTPVPSAYTPPKEEVVDDTVTPFIPKVSKATKSEVSHVDTSATKFEVGDVEKLRKAKEALKKGG